MDVLGSDLTREQRVASMLEVLRYDVAFSEYALHHDVPKAEKEWWDEFFRLLALNMLQAFYDAPFPSKRRAAYVFYRARKLMQHIDAIADSKVGEFPAMERDAEPPLILGQLAALASTRRDRKTLAHGILRKLLNAAVTYADIEIEKQHPAHRAAQFFGAR